jgi:hypothetical protein
MRRSSTTLPPSRERDLEIRVIGVVRLGRSEPAQRRTSLGTSKRVEARALANARVLPRGLLAGAGEKQPPLDGTIAGHQVVEIPDQSRLFDTRPLDGIRLSSVALPVMGIPDGGIQFHPTRIKRVELFLKLHRVGSHGTSLPNPGGARAR